MPCLQVWKKEILGKSGSGMKVLLIDVNCKQGSTGKIVYDLYTELNKAGHTACVCYGRGPIINESNIYKFSNDIEMYFHAALTRLTGLTGYFSPIATMRLFRIIQCFQPDVIHIHDPKTYYMNIGSVVNYLKKNNIKTIWTFHSEFMYTGKCGHAFECEKWKIKCEKCPQVREYPASLLFDFTTRMFNDKVKWFDGFTNITIVTPSNWLKYRVKQSFLKDKDIRVIHNGIVTEIFYPRPYEHLKEKHNITDEKVVLTVAPGLMSKGKGGRYVLNLAKRMKNEKIKFILIGVEDLNEKFDDNVIALGKIENQKELAEYYSLADVFVLASKAETFSLTCAEALCCGTPIVGFKCGAPETIFEQPYAVFVDYGEVDALMYAVESKLRNADTLKIKRDCAAYGLENYSKYVMIEKYMSIYKVNV